MPPEKAASFRAAAQAAHVAVSEIGAIVKGEGARLNGADGQALSFKRASFSHF